ncbi:IS1096 element passenger TnpR family protein [Sinorhizobium medicae]|uniref:IS1096 element passenger TnpR family protein n=1 Tax=Sinorhizobium medicae TaxID=110321 RepID=UPI0034E94083
MDAQDQDRAHLPRHRPCGANALEPTGRCPPEDIGGPWGYQEFREALADGRTVGQRGLRSRQGQLRRAQQSRR